MKVLHVNKFLYRRGGAEAYMEDLAQLQIDHGDEVAFFGMQHPDNPVLPFVEHFPPYMEFDPPPASLVGKARAAMRMLWSTSARAGMARGISPFQPAIGNAARLTQQPPLSVLQPAFAADVPVVM